MIVASQLRGGRALRVEGELYKVLAADYHAGGGKMGGVVHSKLRNMRTGTLWEHRFRSDEKLEDLTLERQTMEFLYSDADHCHFMNPNNFEQVAVPRKVLGPAERFLQPEMRVPVEFFEGQAVSIIFPDIVELKVASTAPPVHSQQDNTWKTAALENGLEIMVPQFIESGEAVRVEVETGRYVERARRGEREGKK